MPAGDRAQKPAAIPAVPEPGDPEIRERPLVQTEDDRPLISVRTVHNGDGREVFRTVIVSAGFGGGLAVLPASAGRESSSLTLSLAA